jgi:group I intron endonuclease
MIIYKTTNLINGKFYIGQDSNNNPEYLGSGLFLNRAIKKYGEHNFVKEILEVCETKDELNEREKYWISKLNAKGVGYNIADGGHGGNTYTDETKRRVSQIIKNRPVSTETRQKRSNAMKGKYTLQNFVDRYGETEGLILYQKRCDAVGDFHRGKTISDEHKKKISDFMKSSGNYSTEFLALQLGENKIGEKNPMWGKSHSEETKEKMSKRHNENPIRYWLGKTQSDESNEKRRQASLKLRHTEEHKQSICGEGNPFYGCKHSEETKKKISESKKSKTPAQRLERYVKFVISRTGNEPSGEQKMLKLEEYRNS